jgi:hypothetical protein
VTAADLTDVHMLGLPVQLWAAAQEHHDELLREFSLMTFGLEDEGTTSAPVPLRLLRLVQQLTTRFAGTSDAQRERLFTAAAAGEQEIDDLVYRLPAAAGPAVRELARIYDEADEYCRAGRHLLTLATPDELRLFRSWYLTQIAAQIEGAAPVPWPAYRAAVCR